MLDPATRTTCTTGEFWFRRDDRLARLRLFDMDAVSDHSAAGVAAVIDGLELAIAAERRRSDAGHWAYDVSTHRAAIAALKFERELLRDMRRGMGRGDFTSSRGTEICVVCHADTGIPSSVPVDQRLGYVEGVGQCCAKCARGQE
jgi:hypothetical protein